LILIKGTEMASVSLTQKLLFVVGKGGVGRSTCALSLAISFQKQGQKVLVVQWSLDDALSVRFGKASAGHKETEITPGISVMNFQAAEAIREYFVDHLGLKILHSLVIENKHVQKLIHAAPGIEELFFLGRILWLTELAEASRGWSYDKIIVDAPATGHGMSLFTVAQAVAGFGMTGPLATECEKVTKLLMNSTRVGIVVTTLAEELPVEETAEFLPRIQKDLGRPPLCVFVNRSISKSIQGSFEAIQAENWYLSFKGQLNGSVSQEASDVLLRDLLKRNLFENRLIEICAPFDCPVIPLPDVFLTDPGCTEDVVPLRLAESIKAFVQNQPQTLSV
jgi:hypothetical protein